MIVTSEFHELANLFPLVEGDELAALINDVRTNGLIEPIWLADGKIVDGRNRYRACLAAGVEPRFQEWSGQGSLLNFVLSKNLHRRHLTPSQRAALAVDILPMLEAEAKQRQRGGQGGILLRQATEPVATQAETEAPTLLPIILSEAKGEARQEAAKIVDVSPSYVSDAKRISQDSPELFEQIRTGEVTIPEAKRQLANHQHINSSASNEWYTPKAYIDAAYAVMGAIDLDPASSETANQTVQAAHFYTADDDGLSHNWAGRVFLNPPYGKENGESNQDRWSKKLIAEYRAGRVLEAILLVNAATGSGWFAALWDFPICFASERIRFVKPGTESDQPTHSNVFVYLGPRVDRFVSVFSRFGPVAARLAVEGHNVRVGLREAA